MKWVRRVFFCCFFFFGVERKMCESQCLLFFVFLWDRCGERDLDFAVFRSGDGDRERLDHLGDLFLSRQEEVMKWLQINASVQCVMWKCSFWHLPWGWNAPGLWSLVVGLSAPSCFPVSVLTSSAFLSFPSVLLWPAFGLGRRFLVQVFIFFELLWQMR